MPLRKKRRMLAYLATLLVFTAPAWAALDAQQILQKSDAVRNPDRSFSLVTTLISYKNGKQHETSKLELYSRVSPNGGQFRSLLRFISPLRDAGKLTLKSGRDLWLYDPASQASVPISPQQRLMGQAANGDVVTANWAADYHASLIAEERIQDGERQIRDCYHLHLVAHNPDAAYPSMDLWVDKADFKSRKAEFYAVNGSLLKTTFYRRYAPVLGGVRSTEAVIIDGVNANWVTVLRQDNFAWRDVPEAWLQRDYLPHFRDAKP
ncbi:outer membrane lipoprotein-sorting protein [Kosakonia sp. BYX6]|uniref:Outer membrane lipoprotein-sorting protein n=1 Tax=Kosakonia calanthes TaxID=3139408 RepID=A0ABZ3B1X0_9ENTR